MRTTTGARPKVYATGAVLLAGLLAPSPGLAQKVSLKWDGGYAFAEVDRYSWRPSQPGGCPESIYGQVSSAVDSRLAATGLERVEPDADPDVTISCRVSLTDVRELRPAQMGRSSGGDVSIGILVAPLYERGTLALEFRDAAQGRLVFLGVAEDTVNASPEQVERRIDRAVERIATGFRRRIELSEPDFSRFDGRTVTAIELSGYRATREFVIRREIRQAIGEPFVEETLAADRVRLENLNIFASIHVDPEETDEGLVLRYEFKEMPPFIPFPAFTYTEENGFSYGAGLSSLNLLGRDIQVSARALFGGTTTYSARISYPWITGNHVSVDFFGAHLERDDELREFEETSDEFTPWVGSYFAGDRGRIGGAFSLFSVKSDVDGITITPDNHDQLRRLGFRIGWDTRDSWRNPRNGWQNELELWRTGGLLGGDGNFWTVTADVRRFQPTGPRDALVAGTLITLQTGEAGTDIPAYMRYHVGGASTIRGYAVSDLGKRLSGKNQWLSTVEYRHTVLPLRRWDVLRWSFNLGVEVAAFGDFGFAWDEADEFAFRRFRAGTGLGLRLLVPGSEQTRFDVGWSRDGGFQFHFGNWSKLSAQRFRLR